MEIDPKQTAGTITPILLTMSEPNPATALAWAGDIAFIVEQHRSPNCKSLTV
jgi:hypothetical protein